MAARRVLRRLQGLDARLISTQSPSPLPSPSLYEVLRSCVSATFHQESHSSGQGASRRDRSRFLDARGDYHAWDDRIRDRDANERRNATGYLSQQNLIFRNVGRRMSPIHQKASFGGFGSYGFSNQSVRFCSSGGALSEGLQGHVDKLPAGLVDVAKDVIVSDLPSANVAHASEIAAATSVSYPWTAVLQHLIDAVHVHTGLPWWASIALATLMVRSLVFPLVVYQVKSTARFSLMRPDLEKIKANIAESNYDPDVVAENKKKMAELFAKHKTNPFTPLIGGLIQAPVFMCFFFGIRTMAEKMESFKEGGCLWFTDLTTPDELFIFPLLTAVTFLITVELGTADGMQGQPNLKMIKNVMRGMAVLLIPLTLAFPKALFCYWVTSNFWSMAQGAVLRQRRVKDLLGIPDVSHLNPATAGKAAAPVITFSPPPAKKPRRLAQ